MRKRTNNAKSPQTRGARTRKRNAQLARESFRRCRRQGWADVLKVYLNTDAESFQDWLYTLTGHEI